MFTFVVYIKSHHKSQQLPQMQTRKTNQYKHCSGYIFWHDVSISKVTRWHLNFLYALWKALLKTKRHVIWFVSLVPRTYNIQVMNCTFLSPPAMNWSIWYWEYFVMQHQYVTNDILLYKTAPVAPSIKMGLKSWNNIKKHNVWQNMIQKAKKTTKYTLIKAIKHNVNISAVTSSSVLFLFFKTTFCFTISFEWFPYLKIRLNFKCLHLGSNVHGRK